MGRDIIGASMDTKYLAIIILFSLFAIIVGILVPVDSTNQIKQAPWQIEFTTSGKTRVFGLTLQVSDLQDMEQHFHNSAELSLFNDKDHHKTVEAYFDKVELGGFNAKVVAVLDVNPQRLDTLYSRGSRISSLGDSRSKITLSSADRSSLKNSIIKSIAYLPSVSLSDQLLLNRFGEPSQKIQEKDNETQHWLYPELGLDIARNASNKAVLQYVSITDFSDLVRPLIGNQIKIQVGNGNH
jgi:hypothetical protein